MATGAGVSKNTISPNLRRIAEQYPDLVGQGLRMETEIEATEVKKRTPYDLGPLRNSVHVEGPFREWRRIYTMIVAGGPAATYAIIVHEDPDAFHDPPTQWKYIESVINESRSHMAERLAKRMQMKDAL